MHKTKIPIDSSPHLLKIKERMDAVLKENIESNRLAYLVNDSLNEELLSLELIDIYLEQGYPRGKGPAFSYEFAVNVFKMGDIEVEVHIFTDFHAHLCHLVMPAHQYDVVYNVDEDLEVRGKASMAELNGFGIPAFLNSFDYRDEFLKEEVTLVRHREEIREARARNVYEAAKDSFPGLSSASINIADELYLHFETGVKLKSDFKDVEKAIRYKGHL